jgi:hypothetical protein
MGKRQGEMILHSHLAELEQLTSSGQLEAAIERCEELLKEAAEEMGLILRYSQLLEQAGRSDDAGLVLVMGTRSGVVTHRRKNASLMAHR